jgi:hypothetical protein
MGCDISLLATDWFLCLFCTSLPMESAARVWDALLCEGPKVLLRVGLAVCLLLGPTLMKKDNPGGGRRACQQWAFKHSGSQQSPVDIETHIVQNESMVV